MFTDEQLEKLEEEEHEHAIEEFALLVLLLSELYDDLEKELSLFYQKYGKNGVVTYQQARKRISDQDKRKRQVALFLTIDEIFEKYFDNFELNFKRNLQYIVEKEISFFDTKIDLEQILSTPWGEDKLTWNERLWAYRNKWVTVISNDLKRAFLKRSDFHEVIDSLDDRFKSMEKILWKLYVSESTVTNSIGRKKIFKEMGVSKYRFYTRKDERTCEQCGSLHGLIFPMSAFEVGVTASPIHPHCRCWEVPIFE